MLGLLACESADRQHVLRGGYRPLYQAKSEYGFWHCSPLATWSKENIWTYLYTKQFPYNPVYDRLAEFGLPLSQRRVAPLTCFRVAQYGSHAHLMVGWRDLFERLAAVFPSVHLAT
jgi:predicted phosphoadenosine phosphosulfate sulfurtransferase